MAPWIWTLLLFCLALFLAVLELFVPSGGILAFLVCCALLASLAFAFLEHPLFGIVYLLGISCLTSFGFWAFFKYWPNSAMGRRILLNPEEDPALQPDAELAALKQLVGKRGLARSKMMLSGLVEVEGRRINAISESEPIESGDEIIVVRVDGINILVRKPSHPILRTDSASPNSEPTIDDPFA